MSKKNYGTAFETNSDLVSEYMEWFSPIHQAFLRQAVRGFAENVVRDKEGLKKRMEENGSANFINPDLWIQCAEDWIKLEDEFNNRNK